MQPLRFPVIKICGILEAQDLEFIARAGAQAIGLNFVPKSPRFVGARAAELSARARALGLAVVGVFMDPSSHELIESAQSAGLDAVQLHGRELPQLVEELDNSFQNASSVREDSTQRSKVPIIKALSWSGQDFERELAAIWKPVLESRVASGERSTHRAGEGRPRGPRLDSAFLVDAFAPDVGGGSGKQARWDLLQPKPPEFGSVPVILAGGLRPDNVASAIQATGCDGVDTASGVEQQPGSKDPDLVRQFVAAARACWSRETDQSMESR